MMTGLPLTDDELARVNTGELPALIDEWMLRDEWRETLLEFFKQAFQQTQITRDEYKVLTGDLFFGNLDATLFIGMMEEAFQTMIVALGASLDGRLVNALVTNGMSDAMHASPSTTFKAG